MRKSVLVFLYFMFMCTINIFGVNEITHFVYEESGGRVNISYNASGTVSLKIYKHNSSTVKHEAALKAGKQTTYVNLAFLTCGDYDACLSVNGKDVGSRIPFSTPNVARTIIKDNNTGLSPGKISAEFLSYNRVRIYYRLSSANLSSAYFGIFDTCGLYGVNFSSALERVYITPSSVPQGYVDFDLDPSWEGRNLIAFLYENGTDWKNQVAYSVSFCPRLQSKLYDWDLDESENLNLKYSTVYGENLTVTVSTLGKQMFTSTKSYGNYYEHINTRGYTPGTYNINFKTVKGNSNQVKVNTNHSFVIPPRLKVDSNDDFMCSIQLYCEVSNDVSSAEVRAYSNSDRNSYILANKLSLSGGRKTYTQFNTAYWKSGIYYFALYEDGKFKTGVTASISPVGPNAKIVVDNVENGRVEGRFKFTNSDYNATIGVYRAKPGQVLSSSNKVTTISGNYNRFNASTRNWLSDDYVLALYDKNGYIVATTSFKCENNYNGEPQFQSYGSFTTGDATFYYTPTNYYGRSPKNAYVNVYTNDCKIYVKYGNNMEHELNGHDIYDDIREIKLDVDANSKYLVKTIPLNLTVHGDYSEIKSFYDDVRELPIVKNNNISDFITVLFEDGVVKRVSKLCYCITTGIDPVYASRIRNVSQNSNEIEVEYSLESKVSTGVMELVNTNNMKPISRQIITSESTKVVFDKPYSNKEDLYIVRLIADNQVKDSKKILGKSSK